MLDCPPRTLEKVWLGHFSSIDFVFVLSVAEAGVAQHKMEQIGASIIRLNATPAVGIVSFAASSYVSELDVIWIEFGA